MTSASFSHNGAFALPLILAVVVAGAAFANESIKLDDGTTCTVIESNGPVGNGTSTSVTAGGGSVSSPPRPMRPFAHPSPGHTELWIVSRFVSL